MEKSCVLPPVVACANADLTHRLKSPSKKWPPGHPVAEGGVNLVPLKKQLGGAHNPRI